ncbi:MAG: TolC family protein [Chitinophagaceae bacterium]|nr:MAG: TolC family protein [Chitinophagaceae bacterium]
MNQRMTRRIRMMMLALVLAASAGAQQKPLALTEAIDLSVKNSKALKGSEARIAAAQAAVAEARDRRLPDASVSGSYLRLNKPNVSLKTGQPAGGNGGGSGESPAINSAAYAMANVSLPIYAGGRIRYGTESAQYLEKAARLDAETDREEVIANTIDAYNNLFKARAAMLIVDSNLVAARERVRELTNQEQQGILARNDLLKAQLAQSNTELALVDAQNNWQLANINMNIMLGLPDSTELLPDSASLRIPVQVKPLADYVQDGLRSRHEIEALSLRRQAAGVGVKAARAERLPSVALTAGYVALTVPNFLTVTNAINLGVGIKYDIASLWKNKARVQAAQAREAEAAAGVAQWNDAVRLQVHQRYLAYLTAQKKIDVNAVAVAQATENDRVIRNKFHNGVATTTELLDADAALLQARLNYAFSKNDAVVAYYKLLQASGTLNNQ